MSTSLTESLTDSGLASPWPLETTQESVLLGDRLENRGQTWVQLDSATWVEAENRRLILPADRVSHWLLVSERRLGQEDLENVFADWQVLGFSRSFGASDVPVRQGLGIRVTMESRWPRRHGVGWTRQPQWLYRLRLLPVVEGSHPELAYLALYCAADKRPPELD